MFKFQETAVVANRVVKAERTVHLYLDSSSYLLKGEWDWNLGSDVIFCSEVIRSLPEEFEGTKGIIHPDDLKIVKRFMTSPSHETELRFRMITTYGEVREISGRHVALAEPEDLPILPDEFSKALSGALIKAEYERLQFKELAHDFAEKTTRNGSWYFNQSTNEAWFSDSVYKIHGLPPQSLNNHFFTFHAFVHPDDADIVAEAYEKAISQRLPLHIEYRAILPGGQQINLLQTSAWTISGEGEPIFHGVLQDKTEIRSVEQSLQASEVREELNRQLLNISESNTHTGFWYINLITRKVTYSEYCYRIFGLRPQNVMPGSNVFKNYVHPDDQEIYVNAMEKIRNDYVVPEMEFRIVRPDGKMRYVKQKGRSVVSENEMIIAGTMQDITVQKTFQLQLKETERKLFLVNARNSFNERQANMGSWVWNLTSGDIEWSESFYELAGLKPNSPQVNSTYFIRCLHPDDQKNFQRQMNDAVMKREDTEIHFRLIKKTGIRNIKSFFHFIVQEGDEIALTSFLDVTDEIKKQVELSERVQLVETLSDSLPDIVIVTNNDNSIVHWNSRCEVVYSRKKEDVIGENFFDVFPHLKGEAMINDVSTALKGQPVELKEYHSSRHGKKIFNIKLVPLKDDNDNVIGVLHMLHDITKEHQLHFELTGRLHFIERVLEATVDRIIVLDRNMNYLYWNRRAEDYYGISKEEVIGKNILELFPGFMNDPSYKEFRNVLKGEVVHIPAEKNLQSKKGYFETYLIPVKSKDGTVSSVLWIVHDLYKEFQLQRQKMKEHEVLDALNENYLELDSDYLVTYINRKGEEFIGQSKEEIIGAPIWEVFPETAVSKVHDAMRKAMEEGVSTRDEYLTSAGRWINISIAPTIEGIVMLFFDIQHIKESQDKLKEEHRRLQEAQSIGHIGSFDWDASSDEIYWSAEMFRIHGLEPYSQSISLDDVISRVHPKEQEAVRELILKARSQAGVYNMEHRVVRPNGEVRIVDRRMRSFEEDGVVTFLTGTVQDVTEGRESEERLTQMQQRLLQTAEASPDAITIYDVINKSPEYINNNLAKWTGYSSEELIAMGYEGRLQIIFPDDRQKIVDFNDHISSGKDDEVRSYEYRIVTRSGDIVWVRNRTKVFARNKEGNVTHILSVLQEITKEKSAQEELDKLNHSLEIRNRELEERNEEIGHFAFVASHDLKEPLRKIHTYSDWLANNEAEHLSGTGRKNLEKIGASVKRMELLIEDIVLLTRMNAYEVPPVNVDMNELLEAVKEDLYSSIEASGAQIKADDLPSVKGHEKQLFQLMKNLIQNAIKFCKPGSHPEVHVITSVVKGSDIEALNARPEINYINISFADNGMGIEEKYNKKVFQMFQKLHTKSTEDCTGAGLFICKKIMDNHGGLIGYKSKPGTGSVFSCYFPAD